MKKRSTEDIICKIFCLLSLPVFLFLFGSSMVETWVNSQDLVQEYVYVQRDSILINLTGLAGLLLVAGALSGCGRERLERVNMDVVAIVTCAFAFLFSLYWVAATDTAPQADQAIACFQAQEFENGNYEGLQKGQYVGIYRHQLGLITFLRLLLKLFGEANWQVFQYLNAAMVPVMIFSGYRITRKITEHNKMAELFYLLLMVSCVPLFGYVPFVYGEIISTTLVMFAAWMLLESMAEFSPLRVILMSVSLGVAVQFRKNTLIFLIAFLIVLLVQLCRGWNWRILVTTAGVFVCMIVLQLYINTTYRELIPVDSREAPASVYIAMGVNSDNGMAGWHNYYDQLAFGNNDWDVEKTNQAAWRDFRDFFADNKDDPGYLASFYYRKLGSQWNSPMYQCLAMNNHIEEKQSALAQAVYFGSLRGAVEGEMNFHQLLVYGAVLSLLVFIGKKWIKIDNYLLLIGVFGGFLFSILWEAKTRYVFPYYLTMLPYGAMGLEELISRLEEKYKKQMANVRNKRRN